MKNELREVGIEKECFLLRHGTIMEPALYGFPYDEMGFLVELRSLPSDRLYPVLTTLAEEELQYKLRANKFGMDLIPNHTMSGDKKWVDYIAKKYKIYDFEDYTKNIYGTKETHHLGVFPNGDSYRLTSGIHVHFSNRDASTGEVIELPIEDIVKQMDESFKYEIERTGRLKGEWEPKKHGFEYRSLPCDTDVYKILKESFKILRSV